MNRPIRSGRDPFGRPFTFDLRTARKKWAAVDHNLKTQCPSRRKSLPSTVLKAN